jgi:hypothetical protein
VWTLPPGQRVAGAPAEDAPPGSDLAGLVAHARALCPELAADLQPGEVVAADALKVLAKVRPGLLDERVAGLPDADLDALLGRALQSLGCKAKEVSWRRWQGGRAGRTD